jgi:mRNA interferase RelE/StbE
MYKVIYSKNAIKDLRRLEKSIAKRIVKKIASFSKQKSITNFSKPLKGFGDNKYRFRIGDYRAVFQIDKLGRIQILMILNVKHRKDIYLQ